MSDAQTIDAAIDAAAELCRRFEGLRTRPYLCPAGVPTIGYGSTRYADGRRVQMSDPAITADAAEALLALTLRRDYLPAVLRLCPVLTGHPMRLAAITDWAYNLGAGNLESSTLRRVINAGDWGAVPAQLRRWVNAGGKRLAGLVARREAEIAVWVRDDARED